MVSRIAGIGCESSLSLGYQTMMAAKNLGTSLGVVRVSEVSEESVSKGALGLNQRAIAVDALNSQTLEIDILAAY